MTSPHSTDALENDARNPCVGCGPEHPTGLRLKFYREGETVASTLLASDRYQGWPNRLHSGVLYLAMLETANWTLYGLRSRLGVPVRTSVLDARRWIATGETLKLKGRLTSPTKTTARVRVEATDQQGSLVAVLERDYDLPGRVMFLKRMGYEKIPAELEDVLPE